MSATAVPTSSRVTDHSVCEPFSCTQRPALEPVISITSLSSTTTKTHLPEPATRLWSPRRGPGRRAAGAQHRDVSRARSTRAPRGGLRTDPGADSSVTCQWRREVVAAGCTTRAHPAASLTGEPILLRRCPVVPAQCLCSLSGWFMHEPPWLPLVLVAKVHGEPATTTGGATATNESSRAGGPLIRWRDLRRLPIANPSREAVDLAEPARRRRPLWRARRRWRSWRS